MITEKNDVMLKNHRLVFDRVYGMVSLELENLCRIRPVGAVDDVESYKIGVLKKILLTIKSLGVVIEHSKDGKNN